MPDMKENELTIEIPDGKIVDWDESKKQNKIVLKDKQLTYKDICGALYKDKIVYYTAVHGDIVDIPFSELPKDTLCDSNNASTKHQLECILAKNKLANVALCLNDGWKPTIKEIAWYIISCGHNNIDIVNDWFNHSSCSGGIIFKTKELARQAIEILGEETVKLAIEPLGI